MVNALKIAAALSYDDDNVNYTPLITGLIMIAPLLWLLLSAGAKRCHDLGESGWMQLIPLYGFVILFFPGQQVSNRYGAPFINPTDATEADASNHLVPAYDLYHNTPHHIRAWFFIIYFYFFQLTTGNPVHPYINEIESYLSEIDNRITAPVIRIKAVNWFETKDWII
jgi:hypothetical protein